MNWLYVSHAAVRCSMKERGCTNWRKETDAETNGFILLDCR